MADEEPDPCCATGRGEATDGGADGVNDRTGGHRGEEGADPHESEPTGVGTGSTSPDVADTSRMTRVPAGTFQMGTDDPDYPSDGEGPVRAVRTDAYYVDRHAVTNAEFAEFVNATGYLTDAERFGWSFVFEDFLDSAQRQYVAGQVDAAPWWAAVRGANWRRPFGPGSLVENRPTHPVVHVSWRDARAYAEWAGKRLPTEAEWERAARGGRDGTLFPWGNELRPNGDHRCNIWQGDFPEENTVDDGFEGTASVDEFEPNRFGLFNAVGNVWEWTADWFGTGHSTDPDPNPTGPDSGDQRVIRGGSYLCHRSYCNRYRLAARTGNTPDSTTGHTGFRCVVDAD